MINFYSAFVGIIPTRVGTSGRDSFGSYRVWDHPHACGDKFGFVPVTSSIGGSSPRVWGQAKVSVTVGFDTGIIPTRVGTS